MTSEFASYGAIRQYCFGTILEEHRRSRPGRPALIDGDVRLTFAQLDERVDRLADMFAQRGVDEGSRMLWIGQNSFRLFELMFAAARLGAVLCPANWRLSESELEALTEDFDPRVIFWQKADIGDRHPGDLARWQNDGRLHIQHDGEGPDGYEALLATGAAIGTRRSPDSDAPFLAVYTAAFDGAPNAALLSSTAMLFQALLTAYGQSISERSVNLVSGPMFHIGVLMASFATVVFGGCNVVMPRVEAAGVLDLVERERATHAYLPLPVILQMRELAAKRSYDLTSLFPTIGLAEWTNTLVMPPDVPMASATGGYGQSEVGGIAVHVALGGTGAGRPYPAMQFRIVDDAGNEVPAGEVGEIVARGPMVMSGYWNRPDENARRTQHGWHHTNDLGRRAEDGSIVFVGPKTTMIKSGIENIYPAEVENCLRAHPAVADVCVIGVEDSEWDQSVKALIVVKDGAVVSKAEIVAHCRERIASYKKPKIVSFVASIPKNAAGFTDRAAADAAHGGGGYPTLGGQTQGARS